MSGGDYVSHGRLVTELLDQALESEKEAAACCANSLKDLERLYENSDDVSFLEALRCYERDFLSFKLATSRVNGLEDELARTRLCLAALNLQSPSAGET